MSRPRPAARPFWRLALAALATVTACGPGDAGRSDLMPALARGVFVPHREPSALGRVAQRGDFPDSTSWAPLPITPGVGWLAPGRGGWHPIGERAVLEHQTWGAPAAGPRVLRLALRHRGEGTDAQRLRVLLEGVELGEVELERGLGNHYFPVPESIATPRRGEPETLELLFEPPLVRRPGSVPVTLTGVGLADEATVRGALRLGADPDFDPERGTLRFVHGGRLIARLPPSAAAAPEAAEMRFELSCPTGAEVVVSVLDDRFTDLGTAEADGGAGTDGRPVARIDDCDGDWREQIVPLEDTGGGTLSLDVRRVAPGAPAEVRRAALYRPAPAASAGPSRTTDGDTRGGTASAALQAAQADPDRPDVIVIILDAARARHFGYAGYERDTTPRIDALAAEGLVFERVFSECPNTSCSIPNLITGVPFLNVGTVFQGRKVPDELTTLAEYLKPLGYRTVGFSANPNNSVARNSHQGFDRFERLWGAHIQADLAAEVIAAQPADEPLFLQLHLLPPHQPYMPDPEFDLFTDPDYDGPVHPKIGLRRYTAGFVTFSPEDLEQLIALYDGNLRMADDAVGRVFDALRASGRWDRSLVLLTADHGEAFGEHGDFQHNSTLYDEMLHVPFVLRLPGGEVPGGVDTASNASLADTVPTILGYLGLEPRPEVWGVDLLRRDPETAARRPLFHRTSHNRRWLLAVRTARYKAITGRNVRRPMLLDLVADPGETVDLAPRRPLLFSALALRLRDFVETPDARVPPSGEPVELSPEEVELLRSLGYVQ